MPPSARSVWPQRTSASCPRGIHLADDLATGRLLEVLSDYTPEPNPVMALYPWDPQLSPRVRVFLDWLSTLAFAS
jgi:DNA-binding transcriptional LysR family regulator